MEYNPVHLGVRMALVLFLQSRTQSFHCQHLHLEFGHFCPGGGTLALGRPLKRQKKQQMQPRLRPWLIAPFRAGRTAARCPAVSSFVC
ncbi:uncharacterized protein B0H64DRAFT_390766 [Chaetomium fimeti]|uniref:Uncharacterized protein n=1 Tax=Chaetomium fimeti TaxID=1854472 RepID=A0AAE0HIQ7_9PEZI|nr:hypothetical protein B0H64DRAFT_390766 [Chaetomium fimeti]